MSEFHLHNKLRPDIPRRKFDESSEFGQLPEPGITLMPIILDERIGSEVALLLVGESLQICQLAEVSPFNFFVVTGLHTTDHGLLLFILFYVPNPDNPDEPYYAFDYHVNPFDSQAMDRLRQLSTQSHWHLFLVDSQKQIQSLFEFENEYPIRAILDENAERFGSPVDNDFELARQDFRKKYTIKDILKMPRG